MTEINPVLTPEEWMDFLGHAGKEGMDADEHMMLVNRTRRTMVDAAMTERRYSAAAAIALYDQSSGFTWADVDRLSSGDPALRNLADRIAALLPPRE